MSTNLMAASREWASRPDDERFESVTAMREALQVRKDQAREARVPFGALDVVAKSDGDLALIGPTGVPARFTRWSFEQLCSRAGAPPDFLAKLPAQQAAADLNCLINQAEDRGKEANLLMQVNGDVQVRAFTGGTYDRAWDARLLDHLDDLQGQGWRVPPARPARPGQRGIRAATEADVLTAGDGGSGLSVKVGDLIAPAGLYAGDRDMFVFMVHEGADVEDSNGHRISRGFFLENSEVGARAFGVTAFRYDYVCGNHIVWGAEDVLKVRIRHVGHDVEGRAIRELSGQLSSYLAESAQTDAARITAAESYRIGSDKEEVLDTLVPRVDLSRRSLALAYDDGEAQGYDPRTAWGVAQGVTRISQQKHTADARAKMDRAAGQILRMAF